MVPKLIIGIMPKLKDTKDIVRENVYKKPVLTIAITAENKLKNIERGMPRFRREYTPQIIIINERHFVRKTVKKNDNRNRVIS